MGQEKPVPQKGNHLRDQDGDHENNNRKDQGHDPYRKNNRKDHGYDRYRKNDRKDQGHDRFCNNILCFFQEKKVIHTVFDNCLCPAKGLPEETVVCISRLDNRTVCVYN